MTQYEAFLSRPASAMRESAIRQMGTVLAQAKDMISFAPGYPAEDALPWRAFQEIATELVLSTRTAERHIANIYEKIGAHGKTARATATASEAMPPEPAWGPQAGGLQGAP